MAYQQPPRDETFDGPVNVSRQQYRDRRPPKIVMTAMSGGTEHHIICTEYNAARLLASLALVLGVRINVQDAKNIKVT